MKFKYINLLILLLFLSFEKVLGQSVTGVQSDGSTRNNIIAAVPFLLILPQARAGAMGNAGVAVLPTDANAPAINMATLAFLPQQTLGLAVSYSPWLKKIAPNMNLSYLSGYYRLDSRNTLAATLRYFSMGTVQFTDNNIQNLGSFNPSELAADLHYARSLGPDFAISGGLRFIYSNLYSGQFSNGGQAKPGEGIAVDVSAIYKKDTYFLGKAVLWSTGLNLSNLGTKISYSEGGASNFLPGNLKLGTAVTFFSEQNSHFLLAFDINKLLVPTQPVYGTDGTIIRGENPDRSVPAGIFGSFIDAPNGFKEELKEIGVSTGMEYCYQQKVSFRAGYNYQHPEKGDSSYFTLGVGFMYDILSIDFAYLVGTAKQSPLANTLRFGLQAKFSRGK